MQCKRCCAIYHIRGKIYSQTDIFSDLRLQRSKHGSNYARSSEQQDILALGYFSTPEAIVVHGFRKSCLKIHCKTSCNVFVASSEKERLKFLPFHCPCLQAHTMLQQLLNLGSNNIIHGYQTCPLVFFSGNRCLKGCNVSFAVSLATRMF